MALSIIETVPGASAVGVGDVDGVVRFVGEDPDRAASPTGTVAGAWSQPEITCALQVAPLKTATVLSTESAHVERVGLPGRPRSRRISVGSVPTLIVGHGPLHRETSIGLAVAPVDHRDRVAAVRCWAVVVEAVRDIDRVRRRVDRRGRPGRGRPERSRPGPSRTNRTGLSHPTVRPGSPQPAGSHTPPGRTSPSATPPAPRHTQPPTNAAADQTTRHETP